MSEQHIIDYIDGRLEPSLRAQVEQAIAQDEQWKLTYHTFILAKEAQAYDQDIYLKKKFSSWQRNEDLETGEQHVPKGRIFNFKKVLAIAATLIALAVVVFLLPKEQPQTALFTKYYEEPLPDSGRSADEANLSETYASALSFYSNENYRQTITTLNQMTSADERYMESRFVLLDALIKTDQEQQAIELAKVLAANEDQLVQQKAQWNLLLIYMKTEDEIKFEEMKDIILNSPIHMYLPKMNALLKELN